MSGLESVPEVQEERKRELGKGILQGVVGQFEQIDESPEIDTLDELQQLERASFALSYVENWYTQSDKTELEAALSPLYSPHHSVSEINNQFAIKLKPCFLEPDADVALAMFRAIPHNTIDEEMVLLTNDEEFRQLHANLQQHLDESEDEILQNAERNFADIATYDRMQFHGSSKRSLETMLTNGMVIRVDPDYGPVVKESNDVAGEGIIPVTEYLKNERLFNISGFSGSKASHAVHDYMDHLWTFEMINRTGILEKYSALFSSIGNPEHSDIYKREGEIVSSVAFGVRLFQTMPSSFGPSMRTSQIEAHLDAAFVNGELETRHIEAYRNIKQLKRGSLEWQSLGFSFSNYLTELDEQRRKFGKIKQRDPHTRKLIGELDPLSPDFVCFFVDTHHQILSSKNKHRDDLFRFQILLEEYLTQIADGRLPNDEPLNLRLKDLRAIDFRKTTLPPKRIMWMRKNYGFTARRDGVM